MYNWGRNSLQKDRQTNSLTPYTGVCVFFLQVKFATFLLDFSQGIILRWCLNRYYSMISSRCYYKSSRGPHKKTNLMSTTFVYKTSTYLDIYSKVIFLLKYKNSGWCATFYHCPLCPSSQKSQFKKLDNFCQN